MIAIKKTNVLQVIKSFALIALISALSVQCDKLKDEDPYEETLSLIKSNNWRLTSTVTYCGGSDDLDAIDVTITYDESCDLDDYWVFDDDSNYETNNGPVVCKVDDPRVEDWGDWGLDESSDGFILWTSSDNPDNLIPDIDYNIVEISNTRMILQLGGCEDSTRPDEDGACVTLTFVAL